MTKEPTIRPKEERDQATAGAPTLTIDWDLYGTYLEDSNLSDTEKMETIKALWSIVVNFVDLGFGVHSAQLATKDCCEQNSRLITPKSGPVVNCLHTTCPQNNLAEFAANAHGKLGARRERSPE